MRKKRLTKDGNISYDSLTGLISRDFANNTTLSFLLGGVGTFVKKKSVSYIDLIEKKLFTGCLLPGTINIAGEIENVFISIKDYDMSWGGYNVTLITNYGSKEKRIKKHDIAKLACLCKDFESLINLKEENVIENKKIA